MIATRHPLEIAFFGSSLVSSYWNGAATYYRGIIREMSERGHRITFYEPDAFERQSHRDIEDPSWAKVVVYPPTLEGMEQAIEAAKGSDVIVKASGVGVLDAELEEAALAVASSRTTVIFWDVDAPATLSSMRQPGDRLRPLIPRFDMVLTYGGGAPVVNAYREMGARECHPVYNALDPQTHYPVKPSAEFAGHLNLLANRLPDRESRIHEYFFKPAVALPDMKFLLGGAGWEGSGLPDNVQNLGHVYVKDHNAFNSSALAVLNVSRESMASNGFSPATRVFEAAGAGACLVTDYWEGIDLFLEPGREVLVAHDGDEVATIVSALSPEKAGAIGRAARGRVLTEHTYRQRASTLDRLLTGQAVEGAIP